MSQSTPSLPLDWSGRRNATLACERCENTDLLHVMHLLRKAETETICHLGRKRKERIVKCSSLARGADMRLGRDAIVHSMLRVSSPSIARAVAISAHCILETFQLASVSHVL